MAEALLARRDVPGRLGVSCRQAGLPVSRCGRVRYPAEPSGLALPRASPGAYQTTGERGKGVVL